MQKYLAGLAISGMLMLPGVAAANTKNDFNWSGYMVSGDFSEIQAVAVVPTIKCKRGSNAEVAFWVGLDGTSGDPLFQDGIEAYCDRQGAHYARWYEIVGIPGLPVDIRTKADTGMVPVAYVHAGDTISMSMDIKDRTEVDFEWWGGGPGSTAAHFWRQTSVPRGARAENNRSAEVVTERVADLKAPWWSKLFGGVFGDLFDLADFGQITYKSITVGPQVTQDDVGGPLSQYSPVQLVLYRTFGLCHDLHICTSIDRLVTTSPLTTVKKAGPSRSNSFTSTWVRSW